MLSCVAHLWRLHRQQHGIYDTGNVINFTCFRDRVEEMNLDTHVYTYPTQATLRKQTKTISRQIPSNKSLNK